MKLGNLLTISSFAVGVTTGLLAALSTAQGHEAGANLFASMSLAAFATAAILVLGMYGISRAAENRLATEVLHP